MRYFVDGAGQWSGGGQGTLRNLALAAARYPEVFTAEQEPSASQIVPRNVPVDFPRTRRPYVLAPQNAWPWQIGRCTAEETWRAVRLRAATEVALNRSSGMLRISSAIPRPRGRPCSPVLHNVLDDGFDSALASVGAARRDDLGDTIVTVGALFSYRNLARLVHAHVAYRARGGGLRLLVAGPVGSPPAVRHLTQLVATAPAVTLQTTGLARADALVAMRDAAGVVLPSLVEASPVTVLEAAAVSGRVLLSDIVGHRELVESLGTPNEDVFCDAHSISSIAQGLHRLERGLELGVGADLAGESVRAAHRDRWAESLAGWLSHEAAVTRPAATAAPTSAPSSS